MTALRAQIARNVALEAVAIDHDRLWRLVVRRILLGDRVRLLVHDDGESLRVGRPDVVARATLQLRKPLRFTASPIEQPDLRTLPFLPSGEEREISAVGTPARRALAVGRRRRANRLRSVPTHHPDVSVRLVLCRIDRRHRVGDPAAIGRDLRVALVTEMKEITRAEWTTRSLRMGCVKRERARAREGEDETTHATV